MAILGALTLGLWVPGECTQDRLLGRAKRYFKRQLCQVVQKGRASECARDTGFAGRTVRNGGVGR